jgi:hypothetical protein
MSGRWQWGQCFIRYEPFSITTAVSSAFSLLGEAKKALVCSLPFASLFDVAECNQWFIENPSNVAGVHSMPLSLTS